MADMNADELKSQAIRDAGRIRVLERALHDLGWKCTWRKTGMILVPRYMPMEEWESDRPSKTNRPAVV